MTPELAPERISFGKAWLQEYDRATTAKAGAYLEPPKEVPEFTGEQYVDFVLERLGDEDFLPENLLEDILSYLQLLITILEAQESKTEIPPEQKDFYKKCLTEYISNFKNFYPPNIEQIMLVVPFTNFGNQYSQQELDRHEYLKKMYVMANGLTYGHTPTPAYYADLVPTKIRKMCSVKPKYANPESPLPTLPELKKLKDDVENALRNLKKLLLPHIPQTKNA